MDSIDLRGKPCPIPVIEVKKLIAGAPAGTVVRVLVDNDIARQNLQKLAEGQGHAFAHESAPEGGIRVELTVGAAHAPERAEQQGGLVVAIGSDCMGRGNDDLGAALMKSFLFSLSEREGRPDHILFFNGGVHLTCEGSASLTDLSALAAKGTAIHSCGACLNYYKKTDKLKVGGVTNMFAIVETMAQAKRLINL